jgi:hypothetical protein
MLDCFEARGAVYQSGVQTDPDLQKCVDKYEVCEALEESKAKFLGLVLMSKWRVPGPGPQERWRPTPYYPVAQAFREHLMRIEKAADRGRGAQFDLAVRRMLAHPESIAALYHFDAPAFVALFGRTRFRAIVGPSIERIRARRFERKELDAKARRLYEGIRAMDATVQAIR